MFKRRFRALQVHIKMLPYMHALSINNSGILDWYRARVTMFAATDAKVN